MRKIKWLVICTFFSLVTQAQGVNWVQGLSWEQVKAKAKVENKYILIDAFATWCGPCIAMDKQVFHNDRVGKYVNEKFIAVKVQMDKTEVDNEFVKKWYADADSLARKYKINAYPTYVFFNSLGEIVHKISGYSPVDSFIAQAKEAVRPDKLYLDPYAEYDKFVFDYKNGKKEYGRIAYMTQTAKALGDIEMAKKLAKDYGDYLFSFGNDSLCTKKSIQYFTTIYDFFSSKSRLFKFFYKNGKRIDRIMNRNGYAVEVVDKTIYEEIVKEYLGKFQGQLLMLSTPEDIKVPDWEEMHRMIRNKFNSYYAKRNILQAKVTFYYKAAMYQDWVVNFLKKIDRYGWDTTNPFSYNDLNMGGWTIFQKLSNKKYLKRACDFMSIVTKRYPDSHSFIDTYANLLYKVGKVDQAIALESRAIELVGDKYPGKKKMFMDIIEKMKKGEPTWTGHLF